MINDQTGPDNVQNRYQIIFGKDPLEKNNYQLQLVDRWRLLGRKSINLIVMQFKYNSIQST